MSALTQRKVPRSIAPRLKTSDATGEFHAHAPGRSTPAGRRPGSELETSPIVGEDDDVEVEPNVAAGACYFNGVAYRIGESVLSGAEWLHCEAPGVWVREGELRPRRSGGT